MQSKPSFWDSDYFIREPNNWHLTEDAPDDLVKEFNEYMNEKGAFKREILKKVNPNLLNAH